MVEKEMETKMVETPLAAETQRQRWVKYGLNVALSVVVVILLAAAIVYIAQRSGSRVDTTVGRVNSLKPQTVNILKDNKSPTKIVALYAEKDANGKPNIYRQPVVDLLGEYGRKGSKIDVEAIDPVNSPSKVDALIAEVTEKYGGEVKKYKDVLAAYPPTFDQIKKITGQELGKLQTMGLTDEKATASLPESVQLAIATVGKIPDQLGKTQEGIEKRLAQKPPDYKAAVTAVEQNMEIFSQMAEQILSDFAKEQNQIKTEAKLRQYMAESQPSFQQIKKLSDDLLKKVKDLGELKLDDLRQSLRAKDAILVMGEKDMRVIPFEQVWKVDNRELRTIANVSEIKPRFAGEQQVSTAILALSQEKKPKVAFVRFGGSPLAAPGMPPFQRGGMMSEVASRLRDYNFEVLEKDLSGMSAMQAQMSGQPPQPEATDEQLKDAIWVVLMFPLSQQQGPMQPPTSFKAVADHLNEGGSALLLFAPTPAEQQGPENFNTTLRSWGIELHPDAVAVHEAVKPSERQQGDFLDQAQRIPYVFNLEDYGDHAITKPLRSLAGFMVPLEVVKKIPPVAATPPGAASTQPAPEVTVTSILPVPNDVKTWGETDLSSLEEASKAAYEPDKGDIPGPIFGGAVAEKKGGGRLVVIGSPMFAFDQWVKAYDPQMLQRNMLVTRYPANAELFNNSIFWLSKMEPMIAISPAAMEVSRISAMSDSSLKAWRIGVLLIGLPMAVLLAGGLVYMTRRD